jgi:hypothetical protein
LKSRASLYLTVAVVALAAAGIVVGLTLDTRTTPHQTKAQAGKPPVPQGLPGDIGKQIETAFRNWPHGSISTMQRLGLQHLGGATPKERRQSAIVQYYRGIALFWAGYPDDASQALERAKKLGTNTMLHNQADAFLHGSFYNNGPPFYPVFTPSGPNKLLELGSRLQLQGHQVSAERIFQKAVRQQPNNVEARVGAAVALFDEDNPTPAFSHLGPLTTEFPRSQVVRYYLGWLLVWTAQGAAGEAQWRKTVELGPQTKLGKAAQQLLDAIGRARAANG